MITEEELDKKYPEDTPSREKDSVERYICTKHQLPTVYNRNLDIVAHVDDDGETECF